MANHGHFFLLITKKKSFMSSCYNFHVFKHIMHTKRATLIFPPPPPPPHKTILIPLLIKISKSFEIQVNILEILRNK